MHARVLFTNGMDTFTLFWLVHTGTDVYHGWHSNQKRSYHASGKSHYKTQTGEISNEEMDTPLRELSGVHTLSSVVLINHPSNFTEPVSWKRYIPQTSTRSNTILTIDSRTIPLDAVIQVTVGLLEPGNIVALKPFLDPHRQLGQAPFFPTKQFLISTAVEPWVWVKVDLQTQDEIREFLAINFPNEDTRDPPT